MNCAQFQNECSDVLEGLKTQAHEEHLASCPVCRSLLEDVQEIVAQASQLPLDEPSAQLWVRLRESLVQEGLIHEDRTQPVPTPAAGTGWSWPGFSWADALSYGAVAAILVLAFALMVLQQPTGLPPGDTAIVSQPASGVIDDDDLQLLREVETRAPNAREAYESSLREINTQIEEATRAVAENPNDPQAVQSLMEAYQQKSMVYEMALTRSVE